LYPSEMAFGPDDVGHWKDKLPYVRHDLELVREREEILERAGRLDFGFDFGAPPTPVRGASYRNDLYVRANHVAPRFTQADASTNYVEAAGFGWWTEGGRETVRIPLTPYHEVRSVAKDPQQLPYDVLYRDYVRGEGPQQFRVKTGAGEFEVAFIHPDRSVTRRVLKTADEYLTIPFPTGEWRVSGLVIARAGQPRPAPVSASGGKARRPGVTHVPPPRAEPGKPLTLTLKLKSGEGIAGIRLHYRAVNQLARFTTLEATPQRPVFTIPGTDILPNADLMYYFEILDTERGGWFEPDPGISTPYYVVPSAFSQ